MQTAFRYYKGFESVRGNVGALPPLARSIVLLFAVPGIVLLLLSFLAGLVSIFVLLLLTVPIYRVLWAVFGGRQAEAAVAAEVNPFVTSLFGQVPGGVGDESPGRKQVEATVVDAE